MIFGSVYESNHGSELDAIVPYEFDESMSFQEMGAQMIEESIGDWNNYMRAIALTELSYVIENHQEYLYEAVDIKAMIDKAKEWFKKLWSKIKGIAKAAMAKFASFGKNDESFINKYEKEIQDGATNLPDGFSYKGYKFSANLSAMPASVKSSSETATSSVDVTIEWYKNRADAVKIIGSVSKGMQDSGKYSDDSLKQKQKDIDAELKQYRGKLVGQASKELSDSEFKTEMKRYMYGSVDKEYIKEVKAAKLIGIVKGASEAISGAKDAQDTIKDAIDTAIEKLNDAESALRDIDTKPEDVEVRAAYTNMAKAINIISSYLKNINTVNASWFSAYITALKDQNRQAKAICVKLISFANGVGGKKKTPVGESSSLLESRFAGMFDF